MKTTKSLKTVAFALGLAVMLLPTLTATAQYGDRGMWDNSIESPYDMGNLGAFDWADFTDLFDQISQSGATDERFSEFRLFDFSNLGDRSGGTFDITTGLFGGDGGQTGGNYGIGIGTFGQDPTAPLGSGLFIMAAAGAAYAFSKKRKKQENI